MHSDLSVFLALLRTGNIQNLFLETSYSIAAKLQFISKELIGVSKRDKI